jgi:UDP-glucose 4-epimerase
MNILITGGAGFIGSHLTDALIAKGHTITILDNLNSGNRQNINSKAAFVQMDILDPKLETAFRTGNRTQDTRPETLDVVFHTAAYPIVQASAADPKTSFESNVTGTFHVLECCRKNDIRHVVFCSTSTVYGNAELIPTPETYPCVPISNYGASKLACEAFFSSYAHTYGMKCTVVRFANIFGERCRYGVMHDFYHKLKKNPKQLEILGNGKQEKSFLHVSDCVSGVLTAFEKQKKSFDIFNVGNWEKHNIDDIARAVSTAMGLKPAFAYTGGAGGWKGDIPVMLLDIKKLKSLGWTPKIPFEDGVRRYVKWLSKTVDCTSKSEQ